MRSYRKRYDRGHDRWFLESIDEAGDWEGVAETTTETLVDILLEACTHQRVHFAGMTFNDRQSYEVLPPVAFAEKFRVVWEIDSMADTPLEAAKEAWEAMKDPAALAPIFTVLSRDGTKEDIDMEEVADG